MKVTVRKEGTMWHGYIEGHPEVDERGLTEEVARRKVETIRDKKLSGEGVRSVPVERLRR
jgi:hypothetical protein